MAGKPQVAFGASLLCINAATWWCEVYAVGDGRPKTWDEFVKLVHKGFCTANHAQRACNELVSLHQRPQQPVVDFVAKFCEVCFHIPDLSEVKKCNRFL